jgi:hypothetical protein
LALEGLGLGRAHFVLAQAHQFNSRGEFQSCSSPRTETLNEIEPKYDKNVTAKLFDYWWPSAHGQRHKTTVTRIEGSIRMVFIMQT